MHCSGGRWASPSSLIFLPDLLRPIGAAMCLVLACCLGSSSCGDSLTSVGSVLRTQCTLH